MICLTLMESSIDENLRVLSNNRTYIDMVEIRLDMLSDPMTVLPDTVKSKFNIPAIITFRKKVDGGNYEGSEDQRRSVLYAWARAGFDYIDLEMETSFLEIEKLVNKNGTKIIRSYHDFTGVPDNLEDIIRKLSSRPGEIAKAAVSPGSSSEALKLFEVFDKVIDIKDKIILGMGVFGLPSRILYKKLGSMLSYCSNRDKLGAPGQISPSEMKNLYRVDKINIYTSVYGIIGNPVMHSKSPELHNMAFQRAQIDAVYIPFKVDDLGSFYVLADLLGINGFSVTVPHKVNVLDILGEKSPELNTVLSCNTVVRKGSVWKGFNTDTDGFLKPLLSLVDESKLNNCAVIGAGGAARAVISALKSIGKEVSIFNRSESRAAKLALDTACSYYPITRLDLLGKFDLIVQTTTVGMIPKDNETPLPGYQFRKDQVVYDIIYTPLKTKFLREAELAGSVVLGGMDMLVTQGQKQFELFTNQPFPSEEQKENS